MNGDPLFPGFTTHRIGTSGTEIRCVVGGNGPPLLMLHGYPQTHAMWHRVAPVLAHDYTVVCPDLRGYGDSGKPESDAPEPAPQLWRPGLELRPFRSACSANRLMSDRYISGPLCSAGEQTRQ